MNLEPDLLSEVTFAILNKKKYRNIQPGLIRRLVEVEFSKGRGNKEVIKVVTSKLHQVAGAYFPTQPNYLAWQTALKNLPASLSAPVVKAFCRRLMEKHASTFERLLIVEDFFKKSLSTISPLTSVLDLACGFNPLALPWMPAAPNIHYIGCDVYMDMIDFLSLFAAHFNLEAKFETCDLQTMEFGGHFQVAFLLKALTCLEHLETDITSRLLDTVPADYLLVSFPVRSLSGNQKGMRAFYSDRFEPLLHTRGWPFEKHDFLDELAYLVKKT